MDHAEAQLSEGIIYALAKRVAGSIVYYEYDPGAKLRLSGFSIRFVRITVRGSIIDMSIESNWLNIDSSLKSNCQVELADPQMLEKLLQCLAAAGETITPYEMERVKIIQRT